ncbi:MAG: preprotein translocase subunit SecE [Tannerella sp.]|nr:preprotein translocase subunit SecE [Tannerella sp.]
MNKFIKYIKESFNELVYKVSWPSRSELSSSAVVVLFASVIIAIVVFIIDFVFKNAMQSVYDIFS